MRLKFWEIWIALKYVNALLSSDWQKKVLLYFLRCSSSQISAHMPPARLAQRTPILIRKLLLELLWVYSGGLPRFRHQTLRAVRGCESQLLFKLWQCWERGRDFQRRDRSISSFDDGDQSDTSDTRDATGMCIWRISFFGQNIVVPRRRWEEGFRCPPCFLTAEPVIYSERPRSWEGVLLLDEYNLLVYRSDFSAEMQYM